MSISYKKYARQIPDWKTYRKQALFLVPGPKVGLSAYVNFFNESMDRNPDAYPFLGSLEYTTIHRQSFSWYFFQSQIFSTGSSHDVHYFSEPVLDLPRVRSKKKRTQNHAILVALSNASRRYTRHNNGGPRAKGTVIDVEPPVL